MAIDGFAQPYGDVAVGGWRNTPYVVIQNVGAYLDVPKFLDSDHPVKTSADAEAYLARLAAYPAGSRLYPRAPHGRSFSSQSASSTRRSARGS